MGYQRNRTLSIEKEQELKFKIMEILDESSKALTIEEIQKRDGDLAALTSQKISRLLGGLIEMGCARKARSNALGRMVYKSTAVMEAQGYDTSENEDAEPEIPEGYSPQSQKHIYPHFVYKGNQWIVDKYITLEDLDIRRD